MKRSLFIFTNKLLEIFFVFIQKREITTQFDIFINKEITFFEKFVNIFLEPEREFQKKFRERFGKEEYNNGSQNSSGGKTRRKKHGKNDIENGSKIRFGKF